MIWFGEIEGGFGSDMGWEGGLMEKGRETSKVDFSRDIPQSVLC
jgi:hypothetical protein